MDIYLFLLDKIKEKHLLTKIYQYKREFEANMEMEKFFEMIYIDYEFDFKQISKKILEEYNIKSKYDLYKYFTSINPELNEIFFSIFEEQVQRCDFCDGDYKCDVGLGEIRFRFINAYKRCYLCDSDPYGEFTDYFKEYVGMSFDDDDSDENSEESE